LPHLDVSDDHRRRDLLLLVGEEVVDVDQVDGSRTEGLMELRSRPPRTDNQAMKRAIVAVLVGTMIACSGGPAPRDPATNLERALDATVGAQSFAVSSTIRYADKLLQGEVRYVAPDRYVIVAEGERFASTIGIGSVTYHAVSEEPGLYQRLEGCDAAPIEEVLSFLEVVGEARHVALDDGVYRFSVPMLDQPSGDGEIHAEVAIEDGHLSTVQLRYHMAAVNSDVQEVHRLHDFGVDFAIEPPPADRIIEKPDSGLVEILTPTPSCPS